MASLQRADGPKEVCAINLTGTSLTAPDMLSGEPRFERLAAGAPVIAAS